MKLHTVLLATSHFDNRKLRPPMCNAIPALELFLACWQQENPSTTMILLQSFFICLKLFPCFLCNLLSCDLLFMSKGFTVNCNMADNDKKQQTN